MKGKRGKCKMKKWIEKYSYSISEAFKWGLLVIAAAAFIKSFI